MKRSLLPILFLNKGERRTAEREAEIGPKEGLDKRWINAGKRRRPIRGARKCHDDVRSNALPPGVLPAEYDAGAHS